MPRGGSITVPITKTMIPSSRNHHTTGHSLTEYTGLAWSEVTTKQSRLAHATTD